MNRQLIIGAIFGSLVTLLAVIGLACSTGKPADAETDFSYVIASVNGTEFTIEDLISSPRIYPIIKDSMIVHELALQEAAKRGIEIDLDVIKEEIKKMIDANGGYDAFLEQTGKSMPVNLIMRDVENFILVQWLMQELIKNEWETTQLPIPDDELKAVFDTDGGRFRGQIAGDLQITPEEVTFEMARDKILEEKKQVWMGEAMATFMTDLEAENEIQFYLFDMWKDKEPAVAPQFKDVEFEFEAVEGDGGGTEDSDGVVTLAPEGL